MIIVKQEFFKVNFLDESSEYYSSLRDLTEAVKSYSVEKLKEIVRMELLIVKNGLATSVVRFNRSPDPLTEHGKNYSREELNILAKAAGIPYYYTYKKHELTLKLGVG